MTPMVLTLALVSLGTLPPATGDELARYRAAAAAYDAGDLGVAQAEFQSLSRSPTVIAPLARFAHGNTLVRQATEGTRSTIQTNELLRAAIADFRAALDASDPASSLVIQAEDARHNLELAKRLLAPEGSTRPKPPPHSSITSDSGSDRSDDSPSAPVMESSDSPPTPPSGSPARVDSGPTRKTKAGLPFGDVGPLDPADADRRLDAALQRIHKARRLRPRLRAIPRSKLSKTTLARNASAATMTSPMDRLCTYSSSNRASPVITSSSSSILPAIVSRSSIA